MAVGGARARAVFSGTRTRTRTEVEPGRNPKTPPINIAENYPARVRGDDSEKTLRENVYFMTTSGTAAARRAHAALARALAWSRTMSPWRERGRERGRPRDEPPDVRALDVTTPPLLLLPTTPTTTAPPQTTTTTHTRVQPGFDSRTGPSPLMRRLEGRRRLQRRRRRLVGRTTAVVATHTATPVQRATTRVP